MIEHRYIYEKYKGPSTRNTCPQCGQRHKLSRYIDTTTGKYIADHVGRCDRENNCGYHYTPKQYFNDNPNQIKDKPQIQALKKETICKPVDYLPFDVMDKSVSKHKNCDLYPFLERLFTNDIASQLCNNFFIGLNKYGDTVFWQVDISGKIRQAKVIQYNPGTGRRNKETGAIFAGKKILGNYEANLQQCFFGEFLLSFKENKLKPVAIVESEKTAIISSIYYPDFVWMATGGTNGAKWTERNVCKVLSGKKVILFPDLGAYDKWKAKGLLMAATAGCKVVVSDILEINASKEDKEKGLDIADYLLRTEDSSGLALTDYEYPIIWDYLLKNETKKTGYSGNIPTSKVAESLTCIEKYE